MKTLNIFLDLDLNKCGYALFLNNIYKDSGVIKTSSRANVPMEKMLKKTMKQTPEKMKIRNKDMELIGEWRKDPLLPIYRYWSIKKINMPFENDIERAEYMSSKLIDIILLKEYGEVNKIVLHIERSNFLFQGQRFVNNRKPEYIGMIKAYLYEGTEYKNDDPKLGIANAVISEIKDINVSLVKSNLKTAYLTLIKKLGLNPSPEALIDRNSKYLSKEVVRIAISKELSDDEADAINLAFSVDKLWYLSNYKKGA